MIPYVIVSMALSGPHLLVELPVTAFDSRGLLRQQSPYLSVLTCRGYDLPVGLLPAELLAAHAFLLVGLRAARDLETEIRAH
jgi:hypothetical protein